MKRRRYEVTTQQLSGIRERVRAAIESIARGDYVVYEGREGLRRMADDVKARGRRRLGRMGQGR